MNVPESAWDRFHSLDVGVSQAFCLFLLGSRRCCTRSVSLTPGEIPRKISFIHFGNNVSIDQIREGFLGGEALLNARNEIMTVKNAWRITCNSSEIGDCYDFRCLDRGFTLTHGSGYRNSPESVHLPSPVILVIVLLLLSFSSLRALGWSTSLQSESTGILHGRWIVSFLVF